MRCLITMDIKVRVGKRIKEIRNRKNISQETLANICNIDRTYINGVENGKRNISVINLEKIIMGLGENIQTFFNSTLFEEKNNNE